MADLTRLTLAEARCAITRREFSAVELVQAHIQELENSREINAYITETPDLALEQASQSDAKIKRGDAGAMEGLPIGVKDLFCTEGVLTTAGSHILDGFVPPYESTVTSKLKDAGCIMVGKTNLDEFAMGSATVHSHYGPTINPWKRKEDATPLVSGGSSGGSAAAVAAHTCLGAIGTDTGGSIRQPASYCGIVGMKPTYGRCSRWGIVAFASSLDQAGPMARTVRDSAIMLSVMAGYDARDSTSSCLNVPNFESSLTDNIKGLRIGIPTEYRLDELSNDIVDLWDRGIQWLKMAGADVVEIDLPHTKYALPTYYIVAPAEASSNLARYDGVRYGLRVDGDNLDDMYAKTRAAGFGAEVIRRILIGTYALSAGYYDAYYLKAQKVRKLIFQDFSNAFEKVDAILTPTAPSSAFPIGEKMDDPLEMYLNDVFTVPASLAGLPGISIPAGISSEGLPLGLQILANRWDEDVLFRVAGVLEEAAEFATL